MSTLHNESRRRHNALVKALFNGLVGLAFLGAIACGHQISEKDIVGTWKPDPAMPMNSKFKGVEKGIIITFTADHKFTLATPSPGGFKGTWALADKMLTVTPTTLVVKNPMGGANIEMPIEEALKKFQTSGMTAEMTDSLKTASEQQAFDVADDGKKLSQEGHPAMIKAE